jgi:hypothetical protein
MQQINIDANTIIQKLGNAFFDAQQMVVQHTTYLVLLLPIYHSFRTFQFINTSHFEE